MTRPKGTHHVDLEYHRRECTVCKHDEIEQIEHLFLVPVPVSHIAKQYDVSRYAIFAHMDATGLNEVRENAIWRGVLEVNSIALAQIVDAGKLKNPARTFISTSTLLAKKRGDMIERTVDLTEQIKGKSEEEANFFLQNDRWPSKAELEMQRLSARAMSGDTDKTTTH